MPAGETDEVRVTVPVKPLIGATVMVEVPDAPATIVTVVGLALTEKSATATLKVTVALCDKVPLVPMTVTVKVPGPDAVHDRVEVPDPVTLVGLRVHVSAVVVGEIVSVRLTTPPNPLRAAMVMVELLVPPTFIVLLVGFAVIVKSWTVTVTVAVWARLPLVPVTVTV
jgi:hypothetical protein